jgi:hypothetical protein
MKIIITENQNYLLRRVQQFIEIVEKRIDDYEMCENEPWWCRYNTPDRFLDDHVERSIEEFISHNWDFFHDDSENGGANMDISMLNKIVEENYGNYIKNLFVRKCNYSRH